MSAAKQITTAEKYLSTATELATTYNTGKYLKKHLGQTHLVGLVTTIQKHVGVESQIHFLSHENVLYLDQIYLYFDKEFNLIDGKIRNKESGTVT